MMIYSADKMERLYRGALRVLKDTGFRVDHEHFLEGFASRGMRVDRAAKRVFVTEELVKELLAPAPGKGRSLAVHPTFPARYVVSGSYPKYYDWPTRSAHPGTTQKLKEYLRVFGAMPEIASVGRVLTLSDVPQAIEPIVATATVIKHSARPSGGEVYLAKTIPYLVELGEIATGKAGCTDYVASCTFVVPPLKLTHEEGEMILEKGRRGIPAYAGTMPSSGATSPVTREGTVVIELAEVMFIWLCYRLVNPEIKLGAICASSSFDMREGTCCFSSGEATLQDCAAAQIMRDYFAADAIVADTYVDAKVPGMQTVYEKLFKALWTYQYLGFTCFGPGLLEAGQTFSPAQAMLEMDIWDTCSCMFKDLDAGGEEVPFETIDRVVRENGTFLDTEHTMEWFRESLYEPKVLDRSARRSDREETLKAEGLMDRAQARYDQMVRTAKEYTAPEDVCKAVDAVVERAKRELM